MPDVMTVAIDAARTAGRELLESFEGVPTGVDAKSSHTDLVSDADRASETVIVSAIRWAFPGDAIVAEEGSLERGGSGRTWYIDPLDGTINYLYGVPHWSVVICLADLQGALAGLVYDPVRDELFGAERGAGAWVSRSGGAPRGLRTTDVADLASTLVATGFAYVAEDRAEQARILTRVLGEVRDLRRNGSAALDLAWVGTGRFDAYFESVDKPWDWMAGALIVREAGGRVTELPQARSGHPHIVASAPGVHDALVAVLKRAVQPG
ncbi:MAG TPA: inositol monophosphatase family protein [Candidatus Limnocylindria bacterium]|jgi:myo-inositol-1(or 4)-monophosphatase|nr:inositol monophosphatase family protein [Candidatus Limnocylindria bacterium]